MSYPSRLAAAALLAAAGCLAGHSQTPDTYALADSARSVGLVLSGGGAKGIAHIGFIQALEEEEIPIDCIAGTSMGAIVGSLYACGYSPAEMMQLLASPDFALWSSGRTSTADSYLFVEPKKSPQWLGVNLKLGGAASSMMDALPTRLINPLPMSFAFMELYSPWTGACRGDFNRLMVPLRTVASDIWRHEPVVFGKGQLAVAVRASMSFPFVFQPIEVDGNVLYDGGLYDVYPVNAMMQDFNPARVVGVNLSSPNAKPGLNDLIGQLDCMIQDNPPYPFPTDRGLDIRFDLEKYGLLDWGAAPQIYAYGYRRGHELADSLHAVIPWRRPVAEVQQRRAAFKQRKADVRFTSVSVDGCSPAQADYIRYLLTGHSRKADADGSMTLPCPYTLQSMHSGFYKVASTGRMRNFVPHAICDTVTGLCHLKVDADVDQNFKLGLGGFLTSGPGSMLYARAGYDPFALRVPGWVVQAWFGPNYMAALADGYINLATPSPSRLVASVAVMQTRLAEKEKLFYDFTFPAFVKDSQFYLKAGWQVALGRHGTLTANLGLGHLWWRYHVAWDENPNRNGYSRLVQNLAMAEATYEYNTLNDPLIPTSGAQCLVSASVEGGHRRLHPWMMDPVSHNRCWVNLSLSMLRYFHIAGPVTLGASIDAGYSTRPLLDTYRASIVNATAFMPLESLYYLYDPKFRANQWAAAGLHPVWSISRLFEARIDAYGYAPLRRILPSGSDGAMSPRYGKWLRDLEYAGEFSVALHLPFGNVKAYLDYTTGDASRWSAGISFGLPVRAPRFTR